MILTILKVTYFNSIKVRLELGFGLPYSKNQSYFNSIKVRLERECMQNMTKGQKFQFHKGAIRTSYF